MAVVTPEGVTGQLVGSLDCYVKGFPGCLAFEWSEGLSWQKDCLC